MALEHPLDSASGKNDASGFVRLWCPKCRREFVGIKRPNMERGPNGTWRYWCEACIAFAYSTKGKGHRDLAGQGFLPFERSDGV